MPHRRTDSWDSETTIGGDSDPLIQKGSASLVLEDICDEDHTFFGSCKRRRTYLSLGLLCLPGLM